MVGRLYALGGPNEEGVIVALTPALYVPSGRDPWGAHLTEEDCVIRVDTGECCRDHKPSGPHLTTERGGCIG